MIRAVFPGKFNPPHIGHARTALELAKRYNLTVVVTRDTPEGAAYTPEQIADEFRALGLAVEIYDGTLTDAESNPFGRRVVVSGNPDVIRWAKRVGAHHNYQARSGIVSGTRIRNL